MGVSVALALAIGFPLGVLSGVSGAARMIVTPVLDVMQTMPAFVHLVAAIFFFGVGAAASRFRQARRASFADAHARA